MKTHYFIERGPLPDALPNQPSGKETISVFVFRGKGVDNKLGIPHAELMKLGLKRWVSGAGVRASQQRDCHDPKHKGGTWEACIGSNKWLCCTRGYVETPGRQGKKVRISSPKKEASTWARKYPTRDQKFSKDYSSGMYEVGIENSGLPQKNKERRTLWSQNVMSAPSPHSIPSAHPRVRQRVDAQYILSKWMNEWTEVILKIRKDREGSIGNFRIHPLIIHRA